MYEQFSKSRNFNMTYIWYFKYSIGLTCLVTRMSDPTWISQAVNVPCLPPHCKYVNNISWHLVIINLCTGLQVHARNIFKKQYKANKFFFTILWGLLIMLPHKTVHMGGHSSQGLLLPTMALQTSKWTISSI